MSPSSTGLIGELMARTTAAAVKSVLNRDYDNLNNPSLDAYIDTANAMVSRVRTAAIAKDITLTTQELELIERWLAAHFYCCSDQPYVSKETQQAKGVYQFYSQVGKRLEGTRYGQAALSLDPSGCLSELNESHVAQTLWLGKAPSAQIDYVDRD